MKRKWIENWCRTELVAWLENVRGIACYDDEPTEELREVALDDYDRCGKEEGFAND